MPARAESITGNKLSDAESVYARCTEIEAELAELQAAYDQFFLGIERRPPSKKHEALKKSVLQLKTLVVRQAAAKFRVQNLAQKLLTLERLWERTLKEIEAGTYHRDVLRAKKRLAQRAKQEAAQKPKAEEEVAEELDTSDFDDVDEVVEEAPAPAPVVAAPVIAPVIAPVAPAIPVARPSAPGIAPIKPIVNGPPLVAPPPALSASGMPLITPSKGTAVIAPSSTTNSGLKPVAPALAPVKPPVPPPQASAPRPPVGAGADGLTDQKIRAIYDAYVTAKKRCGEDTSALSLNTVADTLRKQVPALMKQHNAKSVDFKVVIKDGKAVLRALPKE